jgi:hypothetical protein
MIQGKIGMIQGTIDMIQGTIDSIPHALGLASPAAQS